MIPTRVGHLGRWATAFAAALLAAGCGGRASMSPSEIASTIRAHTSPAFVFRDRSVRCSSYATGHCPRFALRGVQCATGQPLRCDLRYLLVNDPTAKDSHLTVVVGVTEKGHSVTWKQVGERCDEAGVPLNCSLVLYT